MADIIQISSYEELQKIIGESGKDYDRERIGEAYWLAEEKHRDQRRSSGEPYIIHPLSVAAILVELGMDSQSVMAGLLHDVVEDTDCTIEDITAQFGHEVALLIDGVTKLDKIPYSSREEQQAENLRKMLMAMAEDIRVIIIKFADRMHNLSTLEYVSPQKQRDKARECLEVYAPIAHRLGMRTVKECMEDISLKYLDPSAYHEVLENLSSRSKSRDEFIASMKKQIKERIGQAVPNVYIEGRVKSIYSIYRKMFIQGKIFEEIYDVFALRVIVDTIEDCYNVLGIVHDTFQPLPNRFKDYISLPKPNMYQSLHTTVINKAGVPFEVQIRTWEMHYTAEYGIAAHWKYKLGMSAKASDNRSMDDRLSWIRQMLENQAESEDITDLVHSIKSDLVPEEVFVFTPKGDVRNLPMGSTVIDFAYAIHSAVGNRMIGAKVDKRIVPLDYKVKTGEIIEILTTKEVCNSSWRSVSFSRSGDCKIPADTSMVYVSSWNRQQPSRRLARVFTCTCGRIWGETGTCKSRSCASRAAISLSSSPSCPHIFNACGPVSKTKPLLYRSIQYRRVKRPSSSTLFSSSPPQSSMVLAEAWFSSSQVTSTRARPRSRAFSRHRASM